MLQREMYHFTKYCSAVMVFTVYNGSTFTVTSANVIMCVLSNHPFFSDDTMQN